MTKEEYQKNFEESLDKMSFEDLKAYCIRLDANSQIYFKNWSACERLIEKMEVENFLLKSELEKIKNGEV